MEKKKKAVLLLSSAWLAAIAGLIAIILFSSNRQLKEESITAENLKNDDTYLASDLLAGRLTGTPGIALAEEYIAGKFRSEGLSTLPEAPAYFLNFTLYKYGFDEKTAMLSVLIGDDFKRGTMEKEFIPFPFSGLGLAVGQLVFAGYGVTAPEYGYDDYDGLDVRGKIVFVFRHEPEQFTTTPVSHGKRYSLHSSFYTKMKNAYAHGANGIIIVTDPAFQNQEEDALNSFSLLSLSPDSSYNSLFPNDEFKEGEIPALRVSIPFGDMILDTTGYAPDVIQKALDSGQKARDFSLGKTSAFIFVRHYSPPRPVPSRDVAGILEGSDPVLKNEWIVVAAHHDHIGSFYGKGDTIYNGADDNASGTSGVIELSKAFAGHSPRPRHSILFITFSGEEEGLLGSEALFEKKLAPTEKFRYMVNLDMIGRNPDKTIQVFERFEKPELVEAAEAFLKSQTLPSDLVYSDYRDAISDDVVFSRCNIPAFLFFSGLHPDYHGLDDESDRIDFTNVEKRVRLIYDFIQFLDSR